MAIPLKGFRVFDDVARPCGYIPPALEKSYNMDLRCEFGRYCRSVVRTNEDYKTRPLCLTGNGLEYSKVIRHGSVVR